MGCTVYCSVCEFLGQVISILISKSILPWLFLKHHCGLHSKITFSDRFSVISVAKCVKFSLYHCTPMTPVCQSIPSVCSLPPIAFFSLLELFFLFTTSNPMFISHIRKLACLT